MSDYFLLPSVKCLYFKEDSVLYQMQGSSPKFENPIFLKDVDNLWIKRLSKEDKNLLKKDLKKFNYGISKINIFRTTRSKNTC